MRWLQERFGKMRPLFEQEGRLRAAKPLFDAMENFFLAPATRTMAAPHVRDPLDIKRFMTMVVVALIPCIMASFYFFGLRVVAMIVVTGGFAERLLLVLPSVHHGQPAPFPIGLPEAFVTLGFVGLYGLSVLWAMRRAVLVPAHWPRPPIAY